MNIRVNTILLKKLPLYKSNRTEFNERFDSSIRYHSSEDFFTISINEFKEKELIFLQKESEKINDKKYKSLTRKINLFLKINKDPTGVKINKLESLVEAIRAVGKKLPNHWVFSENYDRIFLPYYILEAEFHPQSKYSPTHVSIRFNYVKNEKIESATMAFYYADVKGGKTVNDLLISKGYYFETKELVNIYWKEIENYKTIHNLTGCQFNAIGKAKVQGSRWDSGTIAMERDGLPTRVIMDNEEENEDEDEDNYRSKKYSKDAEGDLLAVSLRFWKGKSNKDWESEDDGDGEEEESAIPPLHPYVRVFDLKKHQFVEIHTNWLSIYKYDSGLADKLVLPESTKSLINILIEGTSHVMEDIIRGKTGGIIVMATGEPGTGKTLTAEVYSESVNRPLYTIQCSQLGTDAEELEEKLTKTLTRAVRWNAILLIDEADVYVHERGDSIEQNAIVGVFLRVLEYYRGILFLTSNRATIIDDAVLSRLTAHIRYEIPNPDDAFKIWKILSEQFKINIHEKLINTLVKEFPKISGRTIKSLLKLSKLLGDREKKPVTRALIKYASQFLDGIKDKEIKCSKEK